MPIGTPETVELRFVDDAGNLTSFPNLVLDGVDAPRLHVVLGYKSASGALLVSHVDDLLASIAAKLDTLNGSAASQATLAQIKTDLDTLVARDVSTGAKQDAAKAVLDNIAALLTTLDVKDFATESTLGAFKLAFDSRDLASGAKQDALKAAFDAYVTAFAARDLATGAKQDALKTAFDAYAAALAARDLATGAKQDAAKLVLDAIKSDADALVAKDYATEATLAAAKSDLDTLVARADIALSALRDSIVKTGATSKTLADLDADLVQIAGYVDGIESALATLNAKDFATQTTLAAVKAKTDNLDLALTALRDALRGASGKTLTDIDADLATIAGYVDGIEGLLTTLNAKDFATSAKQDALKTSVDGMSAKLPATLDASGYLKVAPQTLPPNAAQEAGGNLAALAGKDFATAAKQDAAKLVLDGIKSDADALVAKDYALQGAAITGQSLETGGSGVLGWLASLRKAITDRLPAGLVGGRLDVNLGADGVGLAKEAGGNLATLAGKDFATSAKQDALKTSVDKLFATSTKTLAYETTASPSAQALNGSSMNIVWVKLMRWDGANATMSGTGASAAVGGSYIQIGSNTAPKIPLWTLTQPDTDVLWTGYVVGDIYLTAPANAGKYLVLVVGVA